MTDPKFASPKSITARYDALVRSGTLERDPAQVALLRQLETLAEGLSGYRLARKTSALGWLFGRRNSAPPRGSTCGARSAAARPC